VTTPATAAPDTLALYGTLPQFVQNTDEENGYQFLAWLDGFIGMGEDENALTYSYSYNNGTITELVVPYTVSNNPIPSAIGIQAIDNIVRDTSYAPGWSVLLDVGRCPTYALPWLGQFVGVRFAAPTSDATMRSTIVNLPATKRGTRQQIQTIIDQEIANPLAEPIIFERTAWDGTNFTPDPYAITIQYSASAIGAFTYQTIFADYSSYAAVEAGFMDYGAMYGAIGNLEVAALNSAPAGIVVYFDQTP
jgi:hypothetical protein